MRQGEIMIKRTGLLSIAALLSTMAFADCSSNSCAETKEVACAVEACCDNKAACAASECSDAAQECAVVAQEGKMHLDMILQCGDASETGQIDLQLGEQAVINFKNICFVADVMPTKGDAISVKLTMYQRKEDDKMEELGSTSVDSTWGEAQEFSVNVQMPLVLTLKPSRI